MQFDAEKCTGCGACVKACQSHALSMKDKKPALDKSLCTLCGRCENFCPAGLREIVGREYTVKELIKELLKDKTTAIAGPSGVGKSSLINLLSPGADMETGSISRKIERGKHHMI